MAKTILAVDDSATIRSMISSIVKEAGYDVVLAVDGQDGLEKAREMKDVALVLTDQNMPRMDGFGLCSQLRMMAQYKTIPILFITTEAGDDMKARGRAVRATGWLTKPFEPETLVEVIKKLIG